MTQRHIFQQLLFKTANKTYGQSIDGISVAILLTCCTIYTGYPNRLGTDQEYLFISDRWEQLTDLTGIRIRLSGIQAHSSLEIGENYYGLLRCIYKRIRISHPELNEKFSLWVCVQAINDTMNENGLVSSKLGFGTFLSFPTPNKDPPTQKDRIEALNIA